MTLSPRRSLRSCRCAAAATAVAALAAVAPAASAWGPREVAPELNQTIIQPTSQMRLRADGTALYLARGLDVGPNDSSQLVVRPPSGPAAFASPFPSGFGDYVTTSLLLVSQLDAGGNLLAIRQASPYNAVRLTPGADPAGLTIESTPDRISHVDVAPSGEAAAIVGGGSTVGLSFRPAGPDGRFDTPRTLDRLGQMRSYGIGVTLDPDGGVFVVYRTEQAASILQAYAPPGEDFGAPVQIDGPSGSYNDSGSYKYVQSDNGRGMLVWSEDVRDNSNRDQVYAAVRAPGGLLGAKSLVADAAPAHLVDASAAGITDDGTQYVGIIDAVPLTPCVSSGNIDGDRQAMLAQRSGGGSWTLAAVGPGTWPNTSSVAAIATAGSAVGVVVERSDDGGARCTSTDPATSLEARLGQGAALGGPVTVASESVTSDQHGNSINADGFAVNAAGSAILLTDEPQGGSTWKRFIYTHQLGGGPGGPPTDPGPPAKPLPAPGKIKLSGKTIVVRDGKIPFEASCVRLGPGDKIYCHVAAIAADPGPRVLNPALISKKAKPKGKGKKKKVLPARALARAKPFKIAPGKSKKVTLKLNKLGKQQLKQAGRKGLTVRIAVKIRKAGARTETIERKVTLKAGESKKKAKGKQRPRGKAKR
jgi:hypothetical protein